MTDNNQEIISRLNHRYKVRRTAFKILDAMLQLVLSSPKVPQAPWPDSILLVNPGYLGDVVISTALLPVLKHAFSGVKIGFLVGSYSQKVIENHPLVDHIHLLDYWHISPGRKPLACKLYAYLRQRQQVITEIKAHGYNAAISLRVISHNLIPLLWQARIPLRLGYDFGGFAPLLTHALPFEAQRKHELLWQAELLRLLPIPPASFALLQATLPPANSQEQAEVNTLLNGYRNYRVIHPGSSFHLRDWPVDKWHALSRRLVKEGQTLVFTGTGEVYRRQIGTIIEGLPNCVDACDRLTWGGLVELVRRASLVYSVETSVGHVAAAVGTPSVAIYGAINDPRQWKPYGEQAVLATLELPCAPCFQKYGCDSMKCLKELSVDAVFEAGNQALAFGRRQSLFEKAADIQANRRLAN